MVKIRINITIRVRVKVRVSEFDGYIVRKFRDHSRRHIYDSVLGLGVVY